MKHLFCSVDIPMIASITMKKTIFYIPKNIHGYVGYRQCSKSFARCFSLKLDDTTREFEEVAKQFAREVILPKAAELDRTGEYPWEILKEAHRIGLMNTCIPVKLGGLQLSTLSQSVIAEQLGYGCSGVTTAIEASHLGQIPVVIAGTDEQQRKYLSQCLEEPIVVGFCMTEPGASSDMNGITTKAIKKGDEYIVNGTKMWITNGGVASWYFLLARTDDNPKTSVNKALTGFIVDAKTPGLKPGRKEINMGQRCSDTRGITFEDVRIPAENVVGGVGQGYKITIAALNKTRIPVAASAVGVAQRCLDESTNYALQRKAFGIPIAQHQAVAFLLADMAIGIESARMTYWKAADVIDEMGDNNQSSAYYASIAKSLAADVVNKCATEAIQIFGGNGYNSDYPVEKLFRDSKLYDIYEGTNQIQRLIISSIILDNGRALARK